MKGHAGADSISPQPTAALAPFPASVGYGSLRSIPSSDGSRSIRGEERESEEAAASVTPSVKSTDPVPFIDTHTCTHTLILGLTWPGATEPGARDAAGRYSHDKPQKQIADGCRVPRLSRRLLIVLTLGAPKPVKAG